MAPRAVTSKQTMDDCEDEILFTRAAQQADPDAAETLFLTEGWLARVDTVRGLERGARVSAANTTALRVVANGRLDLSCDRFGADLAYALRDDLKSPRWTTFFKLSVSKFIRQALGAQVQVVRGWLTGTDPVLEQHRAALTLWAGKADEALVGAGAVAAARGQAWAAREQHAEDLTRDRDGLHALLGEMARQRGLPRDWADQFFRKDEREAHAEPAPTAPVVPTT